MSSFPHPRWQRPGRCAVTVVVALGLALAPCGAYADDRGAAVESAVGTDGPVAPPADTVGTADQEAPAAAGATPTSPSRPQVAQPQPPAPALGSDVVGELVQAWPETDPRAAPGSPGPEEQPLAWVESDTGSAVRVSAAGVPGDPGGIHRGGDRGR